ncbi:MAG: methionyl-tRNA formyltransferase [bacterium]|nr:methionyl-tRNA formyltransferase [bacterium]
MTKPSILFLGSGEFAVPVLQSLIDEGFPIVSVITQPDESPIHEYCVPNDISLRNSTEDVPGADIFVIASYGKILPEKFLSLPEHGTLNVHPSLLPKYRGPSPIQGALLAGETETGVTIMLTDDKMDHGPILAQEKYTINSSENYPILRDSLAELGAKLLISVLERLINGNVRKTEQDHEQATFTKLIKKVDGRIDWNADADTIVNLIRAYNPWPAGLTTFAGKNIKLLSARISSTTLPAGELKLDGEELIVGCGSNSIVVEEIQPESKRPMSGEAFARGYLKDSPPYTFE